jgi:hypothetical protein
MSNIIGVTKAAVTAKLLCWVCASFFDGLRLASPVHLAFVRPFACNLRLYVREACSDLAFLNLNKRLLLRRFGG